MHNSLTHHSRTLAVLVAIFCGALLAAPAASRAAVAPPPAVNLALNKARAYFHTQRVHADSSARSRRDSRWALVAGRATSRDRLWAAWLYLDAHRHWQLRYFAARAPFEPSSTRSGRVPCDLYPVFSEPACPPPLTPTPAQIRASMARQLAPSATATIPVLLKKGGYTYSFRVPRSGTVVIEWYVVPRGARLTAAAVKETLIARGFADFYRARTAKIFVRLTRAGRQMLLHRTVPLSVTAKGIFTPILYAEIVATRTFKLMTG